MRRLTSSLMVIAGLLVVGSAARAVDITECAQKVTMGQVGNLVGDLDCSDPNTDETNAVLLLGGATLNLNGFSLRGPGAVGGHWVGVRCDRGCRVNGPGTIAEFRRGIYATTGATRVTDVTITGAQNRGIEARRVKVTRCAINGNGGTGIDAWSLLVRDSSVVDNAGAGIRASKLRLLNVTVTGNGGDGVRVLKVRNKRSTGKLSTVDSRITGNGIDCPPESACYDIFVDQRMRLRNTTYGTCSGPVCP